MSFIFLFSLALHPAPRLSLSLLWIIVPDSLVLEISRNQKLINLVVSRSLLSASAVPYAL